MSACSRMAVQRFRRVLVPADLCKIVGEGMGEWLKPAVLKAEIDHKPSLSKSIKSSCKPRAYNDFSFITFPSLSSPFTGVSGTKV